jgi:hypothetical protein
MRETRNQHHTDSDINPTRRRREMKSNLSTASILTFMSVLLATSPVASAQVGNATITAVRSGSSLDVSVFIQRVGQTSWNLGTSSFVFNYNSSAVKFDSIQTKGTWDASASLLYSPVLSVAYGGGTAQSLETDNVTTGSGTDVPPSARLVATLRFTVTNPTANPGITWNSAFSAFYDAAGASQNVTLTAPVDPLGVTGVAGTAGPAVYSLSQNYPNPFNPSTRISFVTTKEGPVSLRVYDILGREIATLVNENRNPGQYTEHFDGSRLASGMYVFVLKSSEGQRSNRMILSK